MIEKLYNESIEKMYKAIRKEYGYDDEADELIDLLGEMASISKYEIVE